MPLTDKGSKILGSMQSTYGAKKGKSVFYASINAGKIKGAEGNPGPKVGILRRKPRRDHKLVGSEEIRGGKVSRG